MKLHVITGLPRSGSTLLSALLLQNPLMHAGTSSQLLEILGKIKEVVSPPIEQALMTDRQREALFHAVARAYYTDVSTEKIVWDTNRYWGVYTDLLYAMFPQAKTIGMVRHVPWVIDSLERVVRKTPWRTSKLVEPHPYGNVHSRAEAHMNGYGLVGAPLAALKQAVYGSDVNRLMLVQYETLSSDPEKVMRAIYDFIKQPYFEHDFENIKYDGAREFDDQLGTPGLHDIYPEIRDIKRPSSLPPHLWAVLERESFWLTDPIHETGVRMI